MNSAFPLLESARTNRGNFVLEFSRCQRESVQTEENLNSAFPLLENVRTNRGKFESGISAVRECPYKQREI